MIYFNVLLMYFQQKLVVLCVQRLKQVAACAVRTFGIVVEDTVVRTGVRMGVPERRGTAAERRELQLRLRQPLLHLSSESINEPTQRYIF